MYFSIQNETVSYCIPGPRARVPDVTSDSAQVVVAPEERTDPRVARSREKLLDAARQLLVSAGPRAVTVDAVSERSGVAKSTLYRHFPSREALLIDVMRASIPWVAPPPADLGFEAALRHLLRDLADALVQPESLGIMPALIQLQRQMPELRELSDIDRDDKIHVLADVLATGAAEGRIPSDLDPHRMSYLLLGPVLLAILTGHEDEAFDVAELTVDRFVASYAGGA
jgi:AcrR family transcriptional regulator